MTTDPITYICRACGVKYGKPSDGVTTCHAGTCDHCGEDAGLCHVRNYCWIAGRILPRRRIKKMNDRVINDRIILHCAFRYALGRATYVVHRVAEYIANTPDLALDFCERLIEEINESERDDRLGHQCDKDSWLMLRDNLTKRVQGESND